MARISIPRSLSTASLPSLLHRLHYSMSGAGLWDSPACHGLHSLYVSGFFTCHLPQILSLSFLLQPHDTVFTGCLRKDGCGTNPRPPGPSPTLSGFFQMPSSPNFTPRVLFFNSMTPPSLDIILRPVRLIHADRGRHLFCLASSHALISTSTSVAVSPVVHCMAH